MVNEILIVLTLFVFNFFAVLAFRFFGRNGLFCWITIATIAANIEVVILIRAFGLEITLGNSLIASTFVATDILNEFFGKREAKRAILFCIFFQILFILISRTWFLYVPSENDAASAQIKAVFTATPRIVVASLIAYAVSAFLDVIIYKEVWNRLEKHGWDKNRGLWIRNNVSTIISQLANAVIFNVIAFAGIFPPPILFQATLFCYLFYFAGSIFSTPFLYLARNLREKSL